MIREITRKRPDAVEVPLRRTDRGFVVLPALRIHPVRDEQIDAALELILGQQDVSPPVLRLRRERFRQIARQEQYDLTKIMTAWENERMFYACLFLAQPGRTAFLFTAAPPEAGRGTSHRSHWSVEALRSCCRWAFRQDANLIQVILATTDLARRRLCQRSGFRRLTDLIYLQYAPPAPTAACPLPPNHRWLGYESRYQCLFAEVIQETYQDSLDCPELSGLRDMQDVLRSHRAAGYFLPDLWRLLLEGDTPVGVLLLNPLRQQHLMEITYMGLVPPARRRGLGRLMLQEAALAAQQSQNRPLTLAVDCRNHPAARLYRRFGFRDTHRRTVMILSSRWPGV